MRVGAHQIKLLAGLDTSHKMARPSPLLPAAAWLRAMVHRGRPVFITTPRVQRKAGPQVPQKSVSELKATGVE